MPTYGYRCPGCGHEFEEFQKINDDTRAKCPECGTEGERLISGGGGVLFKGSGFYETDYKRAKPSEESKKSGGDTGTGEKKGDKPPTSEGKKSEPKQGD